MMPDELATPSTRQQNPSGVRTGVSELSSREGVEGDLLGFELSQPAPPGENRPSDGSLSADDDDTAQSSTDPATQGEASVTQGRDRSSSFGRFIQNTRKRLAGPVDPATEGGAPVYSIEGEIQEEDDDIYEGQVRPLIFGYLHKYGRNGKWQRRFFETDGESLSYFKSEKRVKLLATLDLFKVGTISMSDEDPTGCTFSIEVADRPYSLRAETKATCKDWVITLNRIKEARMQVGGVKLVTPKFHAQPPDLLDAGGSNDIAPRVVLVANRERTRAIDSEGAQAWEHMVHQPTGAYSDPSKAWMTPNPIGKELGKWKKHQTTLASLSRRLIRWARSIRKLSKCMTPEQHVVQLDKHLHPPGREDVPSEVDEVSRKMGDTRDDNSSWSDSAEERKVEISPPILDDEGEARVLA